MNRKKVYLIDLDGTLYSGDIALPYASQFVEFLNDNKYKYLALTNCPSRTQRQVSKKLLAMNVMVKPKDVLTSGMATAKILSEEYKIKSAYVLGTWPLKNELKKQGIKIQKESAQAVVVGFDTTLTYKKLSHAAILVNHGAMLFSTNIDSDTPKGNENVPHTGPIAKALEFATGKKCIYIGKPETHMLDIACKILSCNKDECVMLGDRVDTDVTFARNCGIASYLVLRETNDYSGLNEELTPSCIFKNLLEVIEKEKAEHNIA